MNGPDSAAPASGFGRAVEAVASVLAAVLVLASVAWAGDLYRPVGLVLYTEQFGAGILALGLLLVFLVVPARKDAPRAAPPWYDMVAGLAGFVAAGYIAVRYPEIGELQFYRPLDAVIAGTVIVVTSIEGLRRTTGWALVVVALAFIAYALWADIVPGRLQGRATDFPRLMTYFALDASAILGTPIIVVSTIVIAFVLFGNLLSATGASSFFTDISLALMGRFRGGSAKIAVTASALFGSISGSAVANVVSTGVVTIPLMKGAGYPPQHAGAIEAVASTGGQLMPPVMGAAAFLMAEFLQISYAEVVVAAILPSILYYIALFIQADLEAARLGITRVEESLIPRAWSVLREGWHFTLSFAVLIHALFALNARPETAALYACGVLLLTSYLFGYQGRRPAFARVVGSLAQTGRGVIDIIMVCCIAGIVIGVMSISGLGFALTLWLVEVAGESKLLLLFLSAIVCLVLGMGMPTIGVYALLAALVAPALEKVGVDRMAAHMFVLYYGMMSMITPPVAVAAFAAASLAKAEPMMTGFVAVRFGWLAFIVPFLFVFSPTLLMMGNPVDIAMAAVTAALGVWLGSIGITGYFIGALTWPLRIAYVIAGLLALIPATTFPGAVWTDVAGCVIGIGLLLSDVLKARRMRAAVAAE